MTHVANRLWQETCRLHGKQMVQAYPRRRPGSKQCGQCRHHYTSSAVWLYACSTGCMYALLGTADVGSADF
jgi:hypothetical protein